VKTTRESWLLSTLAPVASEHQQEDPRPRAACLSIASHVLRAWSPVGALSVSGLGQRNQTYGIEHKLTLNLQPFAVPLWLDNQLLVTRESHPTGFDRHFSWWGGFSQLNWKAFDSLIAYGRYDWLHSDRRRVPSPAA
jgi:hypothetical protein